MKFLGEGLIKKLNVSRARGEAGRLGRIVGRYLWLRRDASRTTRHNDPTSAARATTTIHSIIRSPVLLYVCTLYD